ncbi:hypothetical protein LUZ61_009613 [Rhynchospora tenuis]|uniref:TFIIF beta subunit HTH domain-containing protein n=1 Tax=Rhynchospora tenuis TaxID=198213 RepID=A0AAD5ZXV3_9POAL|nr:hypothetical protein LUZ61_009613 [Rhynchospora tenuis]
MVDERKYNLETAWADRPVWLLKVPSVVTQSWQATGSGDPRKVAVEGRVEQKFVMETHTENFGEYEKLCSERTERYMENQKKVTTTKGSEMKRTRRDRHEMEDIIFKLFERQPNWAFKQLVQETDQPEASYLLKHLSEIFEADTE